VPGSAYLRSPGTRKTLRFARKPTQKKDRERALDGNSKFSWKGEAGNAISPWGRSGEHKKTQETPTGNVRRKAGAEKESPQGRPPHDPEREKKVVDSGGFSAKVETSSISNAVKKPGKKNGRGRIDITR